MFSNTSMTNFIILASLFNPFPNKPWFLYVCSTSFFETTGQKGEIAHNEHKNEHFMVINSLPCDKILDLSTLKSFADDKIHVTQKQKFLWEGKKTLWEMEKMLVTSIFSFFHNVF